MQMQFSNSKSIGNGNFIDLEMESFQNSGINL